MAKAGLAIGIGLGVAAVIGVGVVLAKTKAPSSSAPPATGPGGTVMLNAVQIPATATGAADTISKLLGAPTVTQWKAPSGRTYTVMEWNKAESVTALLYADTPSTLWAVQVFTGQLPIVLLNVLPDVPAQNDVNNFVATQLIKLPTGPASGVTVPTMNLPTDPVAAATMISAILGQPIATRQVPGASGRQYTITQWRSAIPVPATGSVLPQNITVVMIFNANPQTLWAVQKDESAHTVQLLNVMPDATAQTDVAAIAANL